MSDLVKSGEIIAPAAPDLATLAKQINEEHGAFKSALLSSCQRAIAAGKLLLRAKELVEPGHYLEWLAANTQVPERTAQRYMDLASKEAELLAKSPNLSGLSMSGAIRLIEDLRDPEDKSTVTRGSGKSRASPVDSAIKKNPVAVLKKAWDKCNDGEKDEFRQHIQ
jgi:hypothetical protein